MCKNKIVVNLKKKNIVLTSQFYLMSMIPSGKEFPEMKKHIYQHIESLFVVMKIEGVICNISLML